MIFHILMIDVKVELTTFVKKLLEFDVGTLWKNNTFRSKLSAPERCGINPRESFGTDYLDDQD